MKIFRGSKYIVSEDGVILCRRSESFSDLKPRKCFITHDGYKVLSLTLNGVKKRFSIHRIVAELYVENPNNNPVVNHKDCNKQNNHYTNLEWVTAHYNSTHAARNGMYANQDGSKNPSSKLTESDVLSIRRLHSTGNYKHQDIASKFSVHRVTILNIVRRQTWTHI